MTGVSGIETAGVQLLVGSGYDAEQVADMGWGQELCG